MRYTYELCICTCTHLSDVSVNPSSSAQIPSNTLCEVRERLVIKASHRASVFQDSLFPLAEELNPDRKGWALVTVKCH